MESGLLHDFFGNFFHTRYKILFSHGGGAHKMRLNPCEVRLNIKMNIPGRGKFRPDERWRQGEQGGRVGRQGVGEQRAEWEAGGQGLTGARIGDGEGRGNREPEWEVEGREVGGQSEGQGQGGVNRGLELGAGGREPEWERGWG